MPTIQYGTINVWQILLIFLYKKIKTVMALVLNISALERDIEQILAWL